MKKIASFRINHDILTPGVYVSRIDRSVVTYDIRTRCPNRGDYMSNAAMHTVEHLFATFARNSRFSDSVVYFGPMGCRTGFYLLMQDDVSHEQVLTLIREAFTFISGFEGDIPGTRPSECGNYLEHDLSAARAEAAAILPILETWTEADLSYKT